MIDPGAAGARAEGPSAGLLLRVRGSPYEISRVPLVHYRFCLHLYPGFQNSNSLFGCEHDFLIVYFSLNCRGLFAFLSSTSFQNYDVLVALLGIRSIIL